MQDPGSLQSIPWHSFHQEQGKAPPPFRHNTVWIPSFISPAFRVGPEHSLSGEGSS